MRQVAVDTNVLISFVLLRHEVQRGKAGDLYRAADDGELVVIFPQFVIFEAIHVLRSVYKLSPSWIITLLRDAMSYPGVMMIDDRPWPQFFELWSDLRRDVVDAALLAIAIAKGYDLATFDRDLSKRARAFGISPYW